MQQRAPPPHLPPDVCSLPRDHWSSPSPTTQCFPSPSRIPLWFTSLLTEQNETTFGLHRGDLFVDFPSFPQREFPISHPPNMHHSWGNVLLKGGLWA